VPTTGFMGEEHKFENGRLVYWAGTDERQPYTKLERIEHNNQGITVYLSLTRRDYDFQRRYYNISRTELLDKFLEKYVELICTVNDMINGYRNVNELNSFVTPLLQGRTIRELAIFRNCLYAIKGYKFANSTWTDFFNKYLNNYRAQFSNAEVTAMFTNNEKLLLDLIIQYESRK
jgi:predicted PolB exonuclease-like 3'-5' exonuclease